MKKFKIDTEDTILFISRVFVIEGENKEHAETKVKTLYPNSKIRSIEEHEDESA